MSLLETFLSLTTKMLWQIFSKDVEKQLELELLKEKTETLEDLDSLISQAWNMLESPSISPERKSTEDLYMWITPFPERGEINLSKDKAVTNREASIKEDKETIESLNQDSKEKSLIFNEY